MQADLLKRITIEPGRCGGKPCIRGQRMRVTDVLDLLAAGASFEQSVTSACRDELPLRRERVAHQKTGTAQQKK
jgi:hypothetical protein